MYENYQYSKQYLAEREIPKNSFATVNSAIKHMNSLQHIDETISQLDDALSKARLPKAMKVYRAIKTKGNIDLETLNQNYANNEGYTSTSPLYDSSFAKYDDYNIVIELYAPKGTKGAYITPLSDYDTVEQEVLFSSNHIHFTDIQYGVIDKNGKSKTVVKGFLLSKERECYEELEQTDDPKVSESTVNSQSLEEFSRLKQLMQKKKTLTNILGKMRTKLEELQQSRQHNGVRRDSYEK